MFAIYRNESILVFHDTLKIVFDVIVINLEGLSHFTFKTIIIYGIWIFCGEISWIVKIFTKLTNTVTFLWFL